MLNSTRPSPLSEHTRLFTNNAVPFPYTFRDTVASVYFDTVFCFEPGIPFPEINITAKPGFNNYVWNDGTTGPSRQVSQPGKYWVYYNGPCNTRIDTFVFRFRKRPPYWDRTRQYASNDSQPILR